MIIYFEENSEFYFTRVSLVIGKTTKVIASFYKKNLKNLKN